MIASDRFFLLLASTGLKGDEKDFFVDNEEN